MLSFIYKYIRLYTTFCVILFTEYKHYIFVWLSRTFFFKDNLQLFILSLLSTCSAFRQIPVQHLIYNSINIFFYSFAFIFIRLCSLSFLNNIPLRDKPRRLLYYSVMTTFIRTSVAFPKHLCNVYFLLIVQCGAPLLLVTLA